MEENRGREVKVKSGKASSTLYCWNIEIYLAQAQCIVKAAGRWVPGLNKVRQKLSPHLKRVRRFDPDLVGQT